MSKCFVSFSSRDGEFAGKLMASLRLQNVDLWDYSNSAQDIPLGESVKANIRKWIDGSAHFIAVLSTASTDPETGKFTIFEMQYAHQKGKRILPIAVAPFSPGKFELPLEFLADAKYLPFDPEGGQVYERSFARLCQDMAIPYAPPFLGDPRIIFAARFDREIRGLKIPNEQQILLRTTIDDFTRQYAAGKWTDAKETITFFSLACKRFLTSVTLYYPTLLLAVCEMHENNFDTAQKILQPLVTHPLADENLWGALGQICFLKGVFQEALEAFRIAREKCPEGKDWEARFNILAASMELERWEEASAAFTGFDIQSRPLDDQVKIANLQAQVFSRQNDWRSVIQTLKDVDDRSIGNATTAISLADAYARNRQPKDAIRVLEKEAERLHDNNLYHHLAAMHVRLGDTFSALDIYRQHLLNDEKRPYQMITDYAMILRSLGRNGDARTACEKAIELPPNGESEKYFRGLAFYLLGRKDYARTVYLESKSHERYYDQLV